MDQGGHSLDVIDVRPHKTSAAHTGHGEAATSELIVETNTKASKPVVNNA